MGRYKVHELAGRRAYYLKQGRQWCVEKGNQKLFFGNAGEMTEAFPEFLNVEDIARAVDRKKFRQQVVQGYQEKFKEERSTTECYYCNGSGMAGFSNCDTCGGLGKIEVTERVKIQSAKP